MRILQFKIFLILLCSQVHAKLGTTEEFIVKGKRVHPGCVRELKSSGEDEITGSITLVNRKDGRTCNNSQKYKIDYDEELNGFYTYNPIDEKNCEECFFQYKYLGLKDNVHVFYTQEYNGGSKTDVRTIFATYSYVTGYDVDLDYEVQSHVNLNIKKVRGLKKYKYLRLRKVGEMKFPHSYKHALDILKRVNFKQFKR